MGRRSREKLARRRKRVRDARKDSGSKPAADQKRTDRAGELEEELRQLAGGDAVFWISGDVPEEIRVSNLEDILAFESVESGTSLFEGLQEHGIKLPPPEELDESRSIDKVTELVGELARLRIFLTGFDDMSPREFYSTLWNQTLWEACYVEKRNPGALTIIDVSHKMSQSDLLQWIEDLEQSATVH